MRILKTQVKPFPKTPNARAIKYHSLTANMLFFEETKICPRGDHFSRWSCRLVVVHHVVDGQARVLRRTPLSSKLGVGRQASSKTCIHPEELFSSVQLIRINGRWGVISVDECAADLNSSLLPVKIVSKRYGLGIIASKIYLLRIGKFGRLVVLESRHVRPIQVLELSLGRSTMETYLRPSAPLNCADPRAIHSAASSA